LEIDLRFSGDENLQQLGGERALRATVRFDESGGVVETEDLGVVLLAAQRDVFVGKHSLHRLVVLSFVVDQHTVEIKQHRFDHSVSLSHATMLGQQCARACSLTTRPRCDNLGATCSSFRAAPTRSTTCWQALGGAKMRSAPPATPRYGVFSAPSPAK